MHNKKDSLQEVEKAGVDSAGCGAGTATPDKPPC